MVTLNVVNLIGTGVRLDGSVANAWKSLTNSHNAVTNLGLLYAEEELNSIKYIEGTNIEAPFPYAQPRQKPTARGQKLEM